MFTGIITDIGTVAAVEMRGDMRARIDCGYDMATVDLGASIAAVDPRTHVAPHFNRGYGADIRDDACEHAKTSFLRQRPRR